ncbi:asparagine--tRNA ligase [Olsenella sp. Marseille-P4559]|uniref:asparagine--tRNA ligase n=1 Tax=Olsenella sp. Marseille-P4559 TaxID=2364795 RepID=UPI001031597A|nr:asparagine--tRNA ligase [Olsenella sp. Marseille-P4559]
MDRTRIAALYADMDQLGGTKLVVAGWVRSIRDMKNFGFVTLNDGSCFKDLQVVVNRERLGDEEYEGIVGQNVGAALVVHGTLALTPDRPQPFELQAASVAVEGISAPDYPMQKKRQTREFLRTQQHLRSRTNLFRAVFRVRSVAAFAIHRFFQERGFLYVNTPIITASDAEGAGEMFRVTTIDPANPPLTEDGKVDYSKDFFGKPTNLTVSGQLQGENFAMSFGDVYTFGPTFRAENSNTRRHAAEFWMVEPEMAFCDLEGEMDVSEEMLKYVINYVMGHCPDELDFLNRWVDKGLKDRLHHVATSDFARVTYTDAVKVLGDAQNSGTMFEYPVSWGVDLQTEHERYLTEKHFKRPTFVTDYPRDIKAFYMHLNDDGKTVAAADCLVPGIGEIIGGSQREERLGVLRDRIKELGMDPEQYKYYLDLRRYGGCHHAGFGLGFERLVMYFTGVDNIRDVLPHPRTVGNADF